MKKIAFSQILVRTGTRLMLGVALLASSFIISSMPALAAPKLAPAAVRSAAPGPVTGTSCSPGCDLYATTGTLLLPDGATAPIWGYSASNTPGSATLPGPVLVVNEGDPVALTLHNIDLPQATSLMIAGQMIVPDTTGVTAGNSKTYTILTGVLKPGTYLYEAGLVPNGPRQVALGLFGALIVRPTGAPLQAYAAASTAFNDEAVLVLSEIDPGFNADPFNYDMTGFAPRYWLINGKGYPNTDLIATDVGRKVLLRYVNAGLVHHSMSLLGLHQTIVATDGQPETNQSTVVAQTIPAGGTLDTIAAIPAGAPAGTKYALLEAAMHLDNNGTRTGDLINFGGMLTFLTVAGTTSGNGGPVTSNVSLSPNPTSGPAGNAPGPVTLSATITPSSGGTMDAAEYFVDTLGVSGAGCAITGSLTSVSVSIPVSGATAPCVDLTTLSSNTHTFYVHGHDSNGSWGAVASAALNLDKLGPVVSGMLLTPNVNNGTVDVQLQATGNDAATGNQNVTAAEYTIDAGPATAIPVALPATAVSLNSTIPAATVLALANGNHTVAVRAQDALGNWGAFASFTLQVDKTAPNTSGLGVRPNPNNGAQGVQISSGGAFYVRIDATIADPLTGGVRSNVVAAEYFFDTVGANGSGGAMFARDGAFNSPSEAVYAAVDLINIANLSQGQHTIYVHGKDAAGNWNSTLATTLFIVDKTNPAVTAATLTPSPVPSPANLTLVLTATDPANTGTPANAPASNVVAAEWFTGADPGVGLGNAMALVTPGTTATFNATIALPALPIGTTFTVFARAKDAAFNWSPTVSRSVTVAALFANGFESGNFSGWSATGGNPIRIAVSTGVAQAGTFKMAATVNTGTSGFVQDNTPANETVYHARFYINRNTLNIGNNLVPIDIFSGTNTGGLVLFRVQLRRNGGTYQVGATVTRIGGTTSTNWVNLGGGYQRIEVGWQRGFFSPFTLNVGNAPQESVTVNITANNTNRLDTVQLGPQNNLTGITGSILFDSFVSTRNTLLIGP